MPEDGRRNAVRWTAKSAPGEHHVGRLGQENDAGCTSLQANVRESACWSPHTHLRVSSDGSTRVDQFGHDQFTLWSLGNVPEHKQRPSDFLLGSERAEKFVFSLFGALLTFWNRRMRTRMYGGVRRRGLVAPSYSISLRQRLFNFIVVRIGEYGVLRLLRPDYLRF
jgi:hypothetical protein